MNLQAVSGAGQVVAGTLFQPLVFRVTDSSKPPNNVVGASVVFQSAVTRPLENDSAGNSTTQGTGMPVILSMNQSRVLSDVNGMASFTPSVGPFSPPLEIEVQTSAGATLLLDEMESFPGIGGDSPPIDLVGSEDLAPPRGSPLRPHGDVQ
jgi:hypothetical protein